MDKVWLKYETTEAAAPLVAVTMMSLRGLMKDKPIIFYEFVMKCHNKDHEFFGNAEHVLKDLALVDGGGIPHKSIRDIVLSAVVGDGLEMTLQSPTIR